MDGNEHTELPLFRLRGSLENGSEGCFEKCEKYTGIVGGGGVVISFGGFSF